MVDQWHEARCQCELPGCPNMVYKSPHHIKSRGSGGNDDKNNLADLCYEHHHEVHQIGKKSFVLKYNLRGEKWE